MRKKALCTKKDGGASFADLEAFKKEILQMMGIHGGEEQVIIETAIQSIRKNWRKRERKLRRRKDCYFYESIVKEKFLHYFKSQQEDLTERKRIYLVFLSAFQSDLAKAIMTYTDSDYYHVAIALDEGLTNLYSFSPQIIEGKLSGGFTCENIQTYRKNHYSIHVSCMFITPEKYEQLLYEISAMMKRQKQTEYNYFGLVNYVLGRREETNGCRMFCSQFIMYLFRKLDINVIKKEPCFTSPEDIAALGKEAGIYHLYDGKAEFYSKERIRELYEFIVTCNTE